jgi:hypothetical protein
VADSKGYSRRTLGLCLEQGIGLVTLVPRTYAVRQALEAWGQHQSALPLLVEKPGRTKEGVFAYPPIKYIPELSQRRLV